MALEGSALVLVALGARALLFARPSTKPMPFIGFTTGVVSPIAPMLAKVEPKSATAIRGWLAAGTNVASFLVTNHQRWPTRINVYAGTRSEGATQIDTTPVVNAPDFGAGTRAFTKTAAPNGSRGSSLTVDFSPGRMLQS